MQALALLLELNPQRLGVALAFLIDMVEAIRKKALALEGVHGNFPWAISH